MVHLADITPDNWRLKLPSFGSTENLCCGFCLVGGGTVLGQVSCQYEGDDLWVGWSMAPQFCGKGNGAAFVGRCVEELCRVKGHNGRVLLRVSARNQRAIKAYQKAGFRYMETIQDEIAYSNCIEDFWVMALS